MYEVYSYMVIYFGKNPSQKGAIMTKRVIGTALLFPWLLCAETKVTLSESVSLTVEPDRMRTELSFEELSRDENAIRRHFNTLVKTVKARTERETLECRGGGYRIAPQYVWKDKKQVFTGYRGTLSFNCAFGDIENFNALSKELDGRLDDFPGVKQRRGSVAWFVSDALSLQKRELLETMLVRRIEQKREHLSGIMHQECTTVSIAFGSSAPAYPVERMMVAAEAAPPVPIEAPIQGETILTLRGGVEFRCR